MGERLILCDVICCFADPAIPKFFVLYRVTINTSLPIGYIYMQARVQRVSQASVLLELRNSTQYRLRTNGWKFDDPIDHIVVSAAICADFIRASRGFSCKGVH